MLFTAGTALFVVAGVGLVEETGSSKVLSFLSIIRNTLAKLMTTSAVSLVLLILYVAVAAAGIYVMVLASALLSRSLLTALAGSAPHEPIARTIYRFRKATSLPQIVVIGGGTGIKPIIQCLRTENVKLTTIVTMADSGGSTGRLREATGILPPGDFRNALIAMAGDTTRSARLLAYRFPEQLEGIGGHNVGNLLIAALSDIKGGFGDAVQELSDIMQMPGRVLPMSLDSISLRAHFTDGSTIDGEDQIPLQRKTVDTIEVLPADAKPFVPALEAISRADFIIIGPGSLFTSLIPPLSIEATADTIARASATRVLVVNAMTERGETDRYTVGMHVHKVEEVLGRSCIDLVLLSNTPIPAETLARYAAAGVQPVSNDMPRSSHPRVVEADICTTGDGLVRHDPAKLRVVLRSLLGL
ncbi:MAG: gluconeogenesis factor YvcK family protein [Candidatus Cryosericum sp.]